MVLGYSFKIGLVLALCVIAITWYSQDAFSATIGDTSGGTVTSLPGADALVQSFNIEFTAGEGPLRRDIAGFPDGNTPSTPFTETITNNQPGSQITSYRQSSWRAGVGDPGHWVNAGITLEDSSNCTVVSPALTNTCGDITITISSSGVLPGSNDIVVYEFHNTPQSFGDTFVLDGDAAFKPIVTGNQLTLFIDELANTETQAPVGSISIPLDSTSMLVAGNQMNSVWIALAIAAAVGVGIILVRKNYFSTE